MEEERSLIANQEDGPSPPPAGRLGISVCDADVVHLSEICRINHANNPNVKSIDKQRNLAADCSLLCICFCQRAFTPPIDADRDLP